MFEASELNIRNRKIESLFRILFLLMALLLPILNHLYLTLSNLMVLILKVHTYMAMCLLLLLIDTLFARHLLLQMLLVYPLELSFQDSPLP